MGYNTFSCLHIIQRNEIMNTTTDCQAVGESTMITSDCVAIAFKRPTGSNPVNVIGYDLADGETLTISQNVGDVDRTQYDIRITETVVGSSLCYVFRTIIQE
jgi:hypothetical protein